MKSIQLVFLFLFSINLLAQKMEKIIITGIAENSKAGAVVTTKENVVYFLDGINSWGNGTLKKEVKVSGNLKIEYNSEEMLMNDEGEYKQVLSGEIKKILKPKWELVVQPFENDSIIEKLIKKLPDNWSLKTENDKLIILCKEQCYSMYENKINAPERNETSIQLEERFKKQGKLINPQFVFVLKGKLSDSELNKLKLENNKINTEIIKLREKLSGIKVSIKDGNYWPGNKEEEKRVAEYEKEKNRLESKIIKLPDYQSEKYALYIESEIGMETEYISVFPEKYSKEMFKIKNEILKKLMGTGG